MVMGRISNPKRYIYHGALKGMAIDGFDCLPRCDHLGSDRIPYRRDCEAAGLFRLRVSSLGRYDYLPMWREEPNYGRH